MDRDELPFRLPSLLTARPPKLYWCIRNSHQSLITPSLDCPEPPPPTFFIAIAFPPAEGKVIVNSTFLQSPVH
ncbi:unnamed protein product [Protopolystoma xenopodis]|uniref:Uncharacterized protein n=1 Tax=Protopolystoma xenopodis TaxID=117903 RepID=A0A448XBH6_9PLAT|nr:unnamed protein product [Protopolystoma xenopodis]